MSKSTQTDTPFSFHTNTSGTMGFSNSKQLQLFTVKTSERLASMLHVLMQVHQDIDGGLMTDVLELANDMAFQVQQAVGLMQKQEFSHD